MKLFLEIVLVVLMIFSFVLSFGYDAKSTRTEHRVIAVVTGATLFVMLLITNQRFV